MAKLTDVRMKLYVCHYVHLAVYKARFLGMLHNIRLCEMSSLLSSTTAQVSTAVVASALFFAMFSQQRKSSALKTAISENSKFAPSYLPVAIFVGGTAGIGQGTVEAFARHTHGNAHIIIVGRNRTAAEAIISGLPKPTADGAKYEFVECDITSMKNIERTTASLLERLPRVNFLVISTAALAKMGRDETEEGLDKKLTLFFYGRWKFVEQMLPALRNAASKGEVATVYNVAAAGKGKPLDWDNLGLKKTYSVVALREQSSTYLDVISQVRQPPVLSTGS